MPRTILSTVGTSIGGGTDELKRLNREGSAWGDDGTLLKKEIEVRLKRYDLVTAEGRIAASAELNSLERLKLVDGDEVVLLATDTADGRACAEVLRDLIEEHWRGARVTVERIVGLQVRDATLLRSTGLTRFLEVILRYVEDPQRQYGGGLVLNPTGGFKGVFPFMAVMGMLFQVPTVYVFESSTLITLPPLPITFNLKLFQRARTAIAELRRQSVMPVARFYALIPGFTAEQAPLFQSLLECDGADATLSPLAGVLSRIEEQGRKPLYLSAHVREKLEATKGVDRTRLEIFLVRFSDPIWRAHQTHSFHGCELNVFGNSSYMFRVACLFECGRVYVCRLYNNHDDYEFGLNNLRRKDILDFATFCEWTQPSHTPDNTEEEQAVDYPEIEKLERRHRDEISQLRNQIASLKQKLMSRSPNRKATANKKKRDAAGKVSDFLGRRDPNTIRKDVSMGRDFGWRAGMDLPAATTDKPPDIKT